MLGRSRYKGAGISLLRDSEMPLKSLLFERIVGSEPLFKTARELAAAMVPHWTSKKVVTEKLVRTSLEKALAGQRRFSPRAMRAITAAVEERLKHSEPNLAKDILDNLNFELRKTPDLEFERADDFSPLRDAWDKATSRVVVLPGLPGMDHEKVHLLKELVLSMLADLATASVREMVTPNRREFVFSMYTFWLPNEDVARSLWLDVLHPISQYAAEILFSDPLLMDAYPTTNLLEYADKSAHLAVFAVPAFLCTLPIVVLNPSSLSRSGFFFQYRENNKVSIAPLTPQVIEAWYTHTFIKFIGRNLGPVQHISYQSVFPKSEIKESDVIASEQQPKHDAPPNSPKSKTAKVRKRRRGRGARSRTP